MKTVDVIVHGCRLGFEPDESSSDEADRSTAVALALRAKGIFAKSEQISGMGSVVVVGTTTGSRATGLAFYGMHTSSQIQGVRLACLDISVIARMIQVEEVQRAQKWAGDK